MKIDRGTRYYIDDQHSSNLQMFNILSMEHLIGFSKETEV